MLLKLKVMCDAALKCASQYELLHDNKYENDRMFGELLRNVHSIEKGLSLHNIRPGFGYEKISKAFKYAIELSQLNDTRYNEAILMFVDAVSMYLQYHNSINYSDAKIVSIKSYLEKLVESYSNNKPNIDMGGYLTISKKDFNDKELETIQALFYSRHSVREFSKEPVDMDKLYSAIELSHHCPSACNRQGYRVHIVSRDKFEIFNKWFDGIGGFADELDKLILITGVLSMYRFGETMQYIVSSSVFAAYLTMALQAYGIGCCFIQRPVVISEEWKRVRAELNIPGDEQIVCALGIGNLLEKYKAPVSHRLSLKTIVTEH